VAGMGSDGNPNIGGPYEPRISPDGTRFAYYFYVQSSFDDYRNNIRWIDTGAYGTWTYADHFTSPATESEYERSLTQPEWVANDRLLGTLGMYLNMWTWKLGTGHGYTYPAAQWWFGLQDPPDQWGVAAYHRYDDPSLSPDGSRLAMTDQGQQLVVADTHGPAWSGEPPYPSPDYVNPVSDLQPPTIRCRGPVGRTENPTWSRDAGLVAYGMPDGVHEMTMPDCTDRLLIPGGAEPAFGLAGVSLAQAPAAPGSGPAPTGSTPAPALRIGGLSLHPRVFRARRGTTVRFTLSAPAPVTLAAGRVRRAFAAHAGANAVRFAPHLRPGHYRLRLSAGGAGATARFSVRR
jgi:WD40-like Beta Propeller Repeat